MLYKVFLDLGSLVFEVFFIAHCIASFRLFYILQLQTFLCILQAAEISRILKVEQFQPTENLLHRNFQVKEQTAMCKMILEKK